MPPPSFPASERRRGCQPCKCTVRVIREQRGPQTERGKPPDKPSRDEVPQQTSTQGQACFVSPLYPTTAPPHPTPPGPAASQTGPSGAELRNHLVATRMIYSCFTLPPPGRDNYINMFILPVIQKKKYVVPVLSVPVCGRAADLFFSPTL